MEDSTLNILSNGVDSTVRDISKNQLEKSIHDVSNAIEAAKMNRTAKNVFGKPQKDKQSVVGGATDAELYTNISELINGSNNDFGGFNTLLDSLYMKNKKYFSIIKDYEIMPILIPQINRVLMFLVNECLSPDIQNDSTFVIKYTGPNKTNHIQKDIDRIKKEMKLDNLLREVYTNRYKLGREYYLVNDYNKTFEHMLSMIQKKRINEDTAGMSDIEFIDHQYNSLSATVNEASCSINITAMEDGRNLPGYTGTKIEKERYITETSINLNFDDLNIVIERSSVAKCLEDAHAELLAEAYSGYRLDNMLNPTNNNLNEAVVDTSKLETLVTTIKNKKLQRCTIERIDPAKLFKLKIGGRTIGYLRVYDINETSNNMVNFAQSLKDQLLKSRATNMTLASQSAEEVISKDLAEKIINRFDPNIGINRIEDIDLLHNFVKNNEIYKGNKRVVFYYEDEIFDMSRADDSILTNGVFFTKLYATLMLNNIMTKVLRGRGRQIHTVRLGGSPSVQRYIQNAMASLSMPENNLGTLHGSFEQIMNPFNSSSDIVIPTEEENERYITTDYIPGQDIEMNDDFLRTLLNAIVSTFGLDSAIIDATNGNLQFARTLTMESLQICNNIRNEQQDVHDSWEQMCLYVLYVMGEDDTKNAIDQGQVEVAFYEPKSLILQNTIEEINNAKSFAEAIADIIPSFNEDGSEQRRSKFIYNMVKRKTNLDWGAVEEILDAVDIDTLDDELLSDIRKIVTEYKENTKEVTYGDTSGDGIVTGEDNITDDLSDNDLDDYE